MTSRQCGGRSGHPAAIDPPNRSDAGVVVHGEATIPRSYWCGALLAWRHVMAHMAPPEVETQGVEVQGVLSGLTWL